jgi:ribosomal protein S18 acetylase RimI-like enzyme
MEIRKGKIEDIKEIMSIINNAVTYMESEGIYQWDNIYPNEEVITNDIHEGNLYVYIDENVIKGSITLNEFQDTEYEAIKWKYNKGKNLIIHRLCINPKYKGKGIATTLIKHAEKLGKDNKYESMRLDTFTENNHSCKLYEKNGYEKRGVVTFRKGEFFCLEKKLNENITIRQASIEDLDSVAKVEEICFPEAEAATRESLEQRIKAFSESFFVVETEGKVIGFINGCVTNETTIYDELYKDSSLHIPDGAYQTIFGLDVIPEYRNQGIAEQLMNHMIKVSKEAGRKGVILTCKERLIHYYEKFGYVNKGVSNSVHGGAEWYDMILEF